jgi:Zn-dependent protease with chaperone function
VITATYFDGTSTRPHAVTVEADGDFLHIAGDNLRRVEVLRALRFTAAYAHAPSRVDLPGGASLEVPDITEFLSLRKRAGKDQSMVERFEASLRYAVLATLVIIAASAAAYIWGIPLAAELVVDRMPRQYDAQIAGNELEQLERFGMIGAEHALTPREKLLTQRFAALSSTVGINYRLVFRSFKGGPNAFALPDGTILVSDEIEAASKDDDALLFVMAHELGHVRYRHGIKLLARTTLTSIIMSWYVGDVSSALALAAGGIINLSYSRQAESQADEFGRKLLHANGLSTKPAAALFKTLEAMPPVHLFGDKHGAGSSADAAKTDTNKPQHKASLPSYLNTHPPTEERERLLEEDKN